MGSSSSVLTLSGCYWTGSRRHPDLTARTWPAARHRLNLRVARLDEWLAPSPMAAS